MLYLIMVPFLLMSAQMLIHLLRLRRHDRVLFRFCDVRRDLMALFRENGTALSGQDYAAARRLLDFLNFTIHNYGQENFRLFNGRRFVHFLLTYQDAAVELRNAPEVEDPRIERIRREANMAVWLGFRAYTPFFRSQVLLQLLLLGMRVLAAVGVGKMRTGIRVIRETAGVFSEQGQGLDGPIAGNHA